MLPIIIYELQQREQDSLLSASHETSNKRSQLVIIMVNPRPVFCCHDLHLFMKYSESIQNSLKRGIERDGKTSGKYNRSIMATSPQTIRLPTKLTRENLQKLSVLSGLFFIKLLRSNLNFLNSDMNSLIYIIIK
ncbi:hypothetical protein RCL_jg17720.t1 [Rhizophagus clarus]|uniref:Uncharacterized protein n=1 Tax=Rhizophagus clarus TaxID=94130 RepID=A0A8H3L6K6_9GLOM|nr:hypothetical protein RCL_jg17720.t1 [Rhizophagus clarus]